MSVFGIPIENFPSDLNSPHLTHEHLEKSYRIFSRGNVIEPEMLVKFTILKNRINFCRQKFICINQILTKHNSFEDVVKSEDLKTAFSDGLGTFIHYIFENRL